MGPSGLPRDSGLDLVLLGALVAGLGVYANVIVDSAGATPSLVRFSQAPPDTSFPGVLPQDNALLLLADPRTADAATGGGGATGEVGFVLVAVGAVVVAAGFLMAESN